MRVLKGSWSSTSAENIRERAAPDSVFWTPMKNQKLQKSVVTNPDRFSIEKC